MINKPMVRLSVKRRASARKQVDKLIRGVASAHKAGKNKRCTYLASQYLRSFDARLVATWRAYRSLTGIAVLTGNCFLPSQHLCPRGRELKKSLSLT